MGIDYLNLGEVKRILKEHAFSLCYKKALQYDIRPSSWVGDNSAVASLIIQPAHNLIIITEGHGPKMLVSDALMKWLNLKSKILQALQKTGQRIVVVTTDDYID